MKIAKIESSSNLRGYYLSEIGGRNENQDHVGVRDTPLGPLAIVCDGMGGMRGGSMASALAVAAILEYFSSLSDYADPKESLYDAICAANQRIFTESTNNPELSGMGTTVTALLLNKKYAVAGFVGDSRIYQFRRGRKNFRTNDHSMVFQMVTAGIITEEQARLSAQSNIITKALGIAETVEPEIYQLPYLKGDRFLLCTDGFWGAMPESQLIRRICTKGLLRNALQETAETVNALGFSRGGKHDNFSAAVIDIYSESELKPTMSKKNKIILLALTGLLAASITLNVMQCKRIQTLKTPVPEQQVSVGNDGESEINHETTQSIIDK